MVKAGKREMAKKSGCLICLVKTSAQCADCGKRYCDQCSSETDPLFVGTRWLCSKCLYVTLLKVHVSGGCSVKDSN